MLIGVLCSAVLGGLAGTAWSVLQNHDLPQVIVAYPVGGILAVAAFIMLSLLRVDPWQPHFGSRD